MSEVLEDIELEEELAIAPAGGSVLASLEHAIATLPEDASNDTLLQLRNQIQFYKYEAARMLKIVDELCIQRIKDRGPIECGNGVRLVLSHPKTVKCIDLKNAIAALGAATGGDEMLFLSCFSKNALKHGQAKKFLDAETWTKFFETTVKDKLEDGTPAPKKLTKLDDKWLK